MPSFLYMDLEFPKLVHHIHPDRLNIAIKLDGVLAELAAVAGGLVAAKGHGRIEYVVAVDPDSAGTQFRG